MRSSNSCAILLLTLTGVLTSATLAQQPTSKAPPIPEAGPLADPRSLDQVGLPLDALRAAIPADNPQTPEKIQLGKLLFFDGRLSADGTVACSTCHNPARAFTDGRPASIGIEGRVGQRNAPTVLNALFNKTQFWDGRVTTLEEQAALPIVNPVEMGQPSLDAAAKKSLRSVITTRASARSSEARLMGPIWCAPLQHTNERSRRSILPSITSSPAIKTRSTKVRSEDGSCSTRAPDVTKCHALTEQKRDTTYFTDNDFHNIGIGIIRHNVVALAVKAERLINSKNVAAIDNAAIQTNMSALGRFLVTKKKADIASFKTPDLRNVLITAPYFHDGSQETLLDVLDHYNKGDGIHNPFLDKDMQPLALSETDIDDVVAFLSSLTSADYKEQGIKELARQRELARTTRPQRDTARAFGPKPPQPTPPRAFLATPAPSR